MRITSLTPRHRGSRVNVFVDGQLRIAVAAEVAQDLGLRPDEPVDEATLAAAEAADLRWQAREAALSLLAYRARSSAELRRRLLRKAFPPEVVDGIVRDMTERGYLDDDAFARAFVRDRAGHRPRGRRRLVQELRVRGVSAESAGRAVAEVFLDQQISEAELARAAAGDWLRRGRAEKSGADARRRLHAYLARRGFPGDVVRAAVDALLR